MDPISAVLGLASVVPGIVRWVTGDDTSKAAAFAETVLGVARKVTGKDDPQSAVDAIKADPALALQLQLGVMEHERAWWAEETKRLETDARDRESARQREMALKDNTTKILALLVVVMAATAATAVLGGWVEGLKDPITAALVGSIIGSVFTALNQVLQYYFGSSSGSARKDQIKAMEGAK
jgi:hypothetical protein